jgi:polyisoprenoid-binding protein YceI
MKRKTVIGVLIVLFILALGGAAYVFRPTPEASQPIEAMPIGEMGSNTESPIEDTTETTSADSAAQDEAMSAETVAFIISQSGSQVRFTLDEDLRDVPTTVVGVTDQVAGQIQVNMADPAASQVGTISINARTLATDNEFRNRAINNEILDVADYEFITFTPTALNGLPDSVSPGESYSFQITGDLTIRDVTHSETFDVIVTPVSDVSLQGHGETTVRRSDYGLTIPSVPHVANVTDEVLLEIDFIAAAE